ncbi:hypothetical protein cypCar_00015696 [Cyprinus carpio]|nr:hypothetical protein cypCar_00015696 [Cyprinus carpio]
MKFFSYEDFQRLQNEKQALREENQALREENQALREENQALRESTAPRAASDDSGSLQEQVKQVGTMLKTFARTGQSASVFGIKCGRDLKTTVWADASKYFSNHLSINTTWTGVGDKACFRDMF